jgi:serine/threonine protein kinase/DNA-binding NarL/FixJ family response regulator
MQDTRADVRLGAHELLSSLKESGLLVGADLDQAAAAASQTSDAGVLAHTLMRSGILTPYQMDAVFTGKAAELRVGNYDVLDQLGAGGMGTVFKARHRRMKRIVALKVLAKNLERDDSFVRRFQREVETIARLSHPNIVMAYDADEANGLLFLVMEYVQGADLATLVQKQGPFRVAAAVSCILQAARGLEYAHSQGIIHRDIKPANLLRDETGAVKVTDLGLARFNPLAEAKGSSAPSSITQAGYVVGTADYMAPEQAVDSTTVDHRVDIYSLGATLYFLLLGHPPYQGTTLMATLLLHRDGPIPALARAGNEVPAALDTIFRRMMAKTPAQRFQSMTEVVQALAAVETSLGPPAAGSAGNELVTAPPATGAVPNPETRTSGLSGAPEPTVALMTPNLPQSVPAEVLLVEPSRTQSAIIRKYLQDQGVRNLAAVATGQEALRAVKSKSPAVIVCTLHLADMTGVQLAEQVRAECPASTPGFVLISSQDESAQVGSLSKCGKAAVLHKPFTPEQLAEALKLVTAAPASAAPEANRGNHRVLIVDDSVVARVHIRMVLTELGLRQFVEAADGAQAVAAVARESFDLIVTDYNMPFMDGSGLVSYLKQNPATAAVPIIMVTTETDPAKLDPVRRLGVAAICDKSFQREEVQEILDEVLKLP